MDYVSETDPLSQRFSGRAHINAPSAEIIRRRLSEVPVMRGGLTFSPPPAAGRGPTSKRKVNGPPWLPGGPTLWL